MLERRQPLARTCSDAQCVPLTGSSLHAPHPAHRGHTLEHHQAFEPASTLSITALNLLCIYLTAQQKHNLIGLTRNQTACIVRRPHLLQLIMHS